MKKIIILILTLFLFSTKLAASSATLNVSCPSTADPNAVIECSISITPTDLNVGGIQIKHTFTNSTYSSFAINSSIYKLHKEDTTNMVLAQVIDKSGINTSHKIGTLKVKVGSSGTSTIKFSEIAISKTAEEGYAEVDVSSVTKTVTINSPKSGVSTLDSLKVNTGTLSPTFTPTTYNYKVNVGAEVDEIVITAVSNNNANISGAGRKQLVYGENSFTINVTSENGKNKSTYKVVVTREDGRDGTKTLDSLSIGNGEYTLSPAFSKNTTSYKVTVPSNITNVKINATKTSSKSSFASGLGPRTVNLDYGENKYQIKVVAENTTTMSYTITITRTDSRSKNTYLKNLSLSTGTINFDKSTTKYTLTVPNEVAKIKVTAEAEDEKSKVSIGKEKEYALKEGKNTITITVTAENGDTKKYTLEVTREKVEIKPEPIENKLTELTITGYNIDFNPNIYSYNVLINDESELKLNYKPQNEKSTVIVDGNQNLQNGSVIKITVKGDGGEEKIYTINVLKKQNEKPTTPPDDPQPTPPDEPVITPPDEPIITPPVDKERRKETIIGVASAIVIIIVAIVYVVVKIKRKATEYK